MIRYPIACGFALFFLCGIVGALEFVDKLPINLGFQLGFAIRVVPSREDRSAVLGLGVTVDKVYSDKRKMLSVNGAITNYNSVPVENIAMDFAVNSYLETGFSRGRADVTPSTIPPGGTARFSAYIFLQSEKPKFAMYTITAQSPLLPDEAVIVDYPPDYMTEYTPEAGTGFIFNIGEPVDAWTEPSETILTDEDLQVTEEAGVGDR
ncbi:MAG: hypothetical protein LIQ30_10820 [Planctomycetes bacterium]|nr:hypothetical protein [Planctomycetota bacterium]MCD7897760.1 hypothetical protein [Planctomycetaceae bacterium]